MTDLTDDYIKRVIAAEPFSDNEAGIPQMVELIKALHADRDRLAAASAALEAQVARLVGAAQTAREDIAANWTDKSPARALAVLQAALAEAQADAQRKGDDA